MSPDDLFQDLIVTANQQVANDAANLDLEPAYDIRSTITRIADILKSFCCVGKRPIHDTGLEKMLAAAAKMTSDAFVHFEADATQHMDDAQDATRVA
ncbi:hypothetical protein ACOI1H_20705 [Loktanella sp. DJP18]|uniref:hypothetical protein n=1 Tax=Loktanella sp. DJP18 TaxID=3409788 RepID=UPI003BB4C05A